MFYLEGWQLNLTFRSSPQEKSSRLNGFLRDQEVGTLRVVLAGDGKQWLLPSEQESGQQP
jgi:hypothetical protein